jgi:hypothetical protein
MIHIAYLTIKLDISLNKDLPIGLIINILWKYVNYVIERFFILSYNITIYIDII